MQTGTLILSRLDQNINKLIKIDVYLDGKRLYALADNETKSFEIEAGDYVLSAKIDWCRSNKLPIRITNGVTSKVEMGSPVDVSLKPVPLLVDLLIFLVPALIGEFWDIKLETIIWAMISSLLLWTVLSKKKPLIYYMTFGYKEYLFLREID